MSIREWGLVLVVAFIAWCWYVALATIRALHREILDRADKHFAELAAAQKQGERNKFMADMLKDSEED